MKQSFIRLVRRLRQSLVLHVKTPTIDFRQLTIPYISRGDLRSGAASFGGTRNEYALWRPNICSICCVKAIGDAVGTTKNLNLFELLQLACNDKVFIQLKDGGIRGAFHYPLRDLLSRLSIPSRVAAKLPLQTIKDNLAVGRVVFLSIDLTKSRHITSHEGHLIVVYSYDPERDSFTIHDSSSAIALNGNAAKIGSKYLKELSNNRGLIIG